MEARSLPTHAGPVPDRITIRSMDDGSYRLDATFQGASGYERATWHEQDLRENGVQYSLRQELDGGWTVRLGPLGQMRSA